MRLTVNWELVVWLEKNLVVANGISALASGRWLSSILPTVEELHLTADHGWWGPAEAQGCSERGGGG